MAAKLVMGAAKLVMGAFNVGCSYPQCFPVLGGNIARSRDGPLRAPLRHPRKQLLVLRTADVQTPKALLHCEDLADMFAPECRGVRVDVPRQEPLHPHAIEEVIPTDRAERGCRRHPPPHREDVGPKRGAQLVSLIFGIPSKVTLFFRRLFRDVERAVFREAHRALRGSWSGSSGRNVLFSQTGMAASTGEVYDQFGHGNRRACFLILVFSLQWKLLLRVACMHACMPHH